MNVGIELILANLGISFETLVLIVFSFGGLLFYAKDFKIGMILDFITAGAIFVWFYIEGYNFAKIIIVLFLRLIIMSFSLYAITKSENQPLI